MRRALGVLALLGAATLARADDAPPPAEVVKAATSDQRAWADALARELARPLEGVDDVTVLDVEAKVELIHAGYKVELERATLRRVRCASDEDVRREVAAGGQVCPRDGRWVTSLPFFSVDGDVDVARLLAKVDEAWAPGQEPPADIATRLGMDLGKETARGPDPDAREERPARAGWRGARARLQGGLVVERRRAADAVVADRMFGCEVKPRAGARTLIALRGDEVVACAGEPLADAALGARALRAAFGPAPLESVGVFGPETTPGESDRVAAVAWKAGGELYRSGATLLRNAREKPGARSLEGDVRWRFVDAARNHVLVRTRGDARELFAEARVTASSMFVVLAPSEASHGEEKAYLQALLQGLGLALPPDAPGLVELVEERR